MATKMTATKAQTMTTIFCGFCPHPKNCCLLIADAAYVSDGEENVIDPDRDRDPDLDVDDLHAGRVHAAHVVREHVVLSASHGVGEIGESQLVEARQELVEVLAAEQPKHPLAHHFGALPTRDHQL